MDDDDEKWEDPGVPSGGKSHPRGGNDIDDVDNQEDMQGGDKATRKEIGTKDGNVKR